MKIGFLLLLLSINLSMSAQKVNIIYVGDPMCSWCYGISNELDKVLEQYGDDIEMKVIVGGLRNGGGDKWTPQFREFLRNHWIEVHERSGAEFSYDLLDWSSFNYDTEPICRSIVVVQQMKPDLDWKFFKAAQRHFYFDNKDPQEQAFYKPLCKKYGIDYVEFSKLWNSAEIKKLTQQQFSYASKIGARGFPSVYLEINGQLILIASGYSEAEKIIKRIEERI